MGKYITCIAALIFQITQRGGIAMKVRALQQALNSVPKGILSFLETKNPTIQLLEEFVALFNKPSEQDSDITFYDFACYMRAKDCPADSYFIKAYFSDSKNTDAIKILKQFEDFEAITKLLDGELRELTTKGALAKDEFSNNFYRISQWSQYASDIFAVINLTLTEFPYSNLRTV